MDLHINERSLLCSWSRSVRSGSNSTHGIDPCGRDHADGWGGFPRSRSEEELYVLGKQRPLRLEGVYTIIPEATRFYT